ncbi:MAG: nucleotidyl transferase AbiEii/AbiGii toxin family protein [Desulfatitalea sp.]
MARFKAHFKAFNDRYTLIGGTACFLSMDQVGLDFRATKDLDIVLCVEALGADFVNAFWDFIRQGQYKNQQKSTGRMLFYRFYDPEDDTFPIMLELFSRTPDALQLQNDSHLTPIPMGEAASSLSAILLDDDYYRFILDGKQEIDGLPVVGPAHLIPLKARAWLDMTQRRNQGETIDERDIRKHRNDVFRLYQLLSPDSALEMPDMVRGDLQRFINAMTGEPSIQLKSFGLKNTTLEELLGQIRTIYGLDHQRGRSTLPSSKRR